jgi:predicted XRE-type DNA-binding protein
MTANFDFSSGDVFRDLGFSDRESEDLRLRSDLMIELKNQILALGSSQNQIAALLAVSQPRVSNLLQGRIDKFSLDSLVAMLERLGNRVEVSVRDRIETTASFTFDTGGRSEWPTLTLPDSLQDFIQCVTDGHPLQVAADSQYALAA